MKKEERFESSTSAILCPVSSSLKNATYRGNAAAHAAQDANFKVLTRRRIMVIPPVLDTGDCEFESHRRDQLEIAFERDFDGRSSYIEYEHCAVSSD